MSDMDEALTRIRREAKEWTGKLDLRGLDLDELPDEMFALTHLRILQLAREDFRIGACRIIENDNRFTVFKELQQLGVRRCDLSSLSFVRGLTELQSLDCAWTPVSDLSTISGLNQLKYLDCSGTTVSNLSPLQNLKRLSSLRCGYTGVRDIGPLRGLGKLQHLQCARTPVDDLSPIRDLVQLEWLDCASTPITDLAPLRELTRLHALDCSRTSVSVLAPLKYLPELSVLNCSDCPLIDLPEELIRAPALLVLMLANVALPGWPATGVLSTDHADNCLPRVRAHLDDLADGAVLDPRIKLLILGNGGAGKTQIAHWLADAGYRLNPHWDSTHGIEVRRAVMAGEPALTLSIWDFGGQDLYHGAHALFLNSPALLLLVWAKDTEERGGHGDGELWFRDHPLPYWLALARHQAHAYSPLILTQSKCDRVGDRVRPFPVDAALLDALPYPAPQLYLSVGAGTGRDGLVEEMRIAANWLRDPTRMGVPRVGRGRVAVRDRLEEMRAAGTRLLPMADFRAVCAEIGGVSAPDHLLTWLDAEGVVFYRPGLFQDQVVLDPSWALAAIYTIFDRKSGMAKAVKGQRGRFTRDLLSETLWRDYSPKEQEVFLSMMLSCGICFVLREWWEDGEWLREYVAPDLLPDRDAVVGLVPVRWSDSAPTHEAVYTYPILHGGLIRTILSRIGGMAGEDALYWRGGLCGYETRYRSRFLIEQDMTGEWSGRIVLRTQDGNAVGLLSRLQEIVEDAAALIGLRGERAAAEMQRRGAEVEPVPDAPPVAAPPDLTTGADPVKVPEWYVSYAWKDADNPDIEQPVDALCAEAAKRGIRIKRDRTDLGPGDGRISAFMEKIGAGERIVVVMSEKYLRSPFCMHELHAIWRRSRTDGEFINRVRLWAPGTVPIWKPKDWVGWNQHWFKEFNELAGCLESGQPPSLLGEHGMRRLLSMQDFYTKAGDILGTLADHVHKREWADFLDYVFQDID